MRIIITLIFLISFLMGKSQMNAQSSILKSASIDLNTNLVKQLFRKTKRIMKVLDIPIRKNLSKDGHLSFYINALEGATLAAFQFKEKDAVNLKNDPFKYYKVSRICITETLDSILSNKKKVKNEELVKAKGVFAHEICHYFQQANDNNYFNSTDIIFNQDVGSYISTSRKYMKQRDEFEAFAVDAYYFLSKMNKKQLKKIMVLKISGDRKWELLINAMRKIDAPGDPIIFDDM